MSPGVENLLRKALKLREHYLGTALGWLEEAEQSAAVARRRVADLEQEIADLEKALAGEAAAASVELDLEQDGDQ